MLKRKTQICLSNVHYNLLSAKEQQKDKSMRTDWGNLCIFPYYFSGVSLHLRNQPHEKLFHRWSWLSNSINIFLHIRRTTTLQCSRRESEQDIKLLWIGRWVWNAERCRLLYKESWKKRRAESGGSSENLERRGEWAGSRLKRRGSQSFKEWS